MTSMAAAACTQRGCGGTIEDGHCTAAAGAGVGPAPALASGSVRGSASGPPRLRPGRVALLGLPRPRRRGGSSASASISGSVGHGSRPGSRARGRAAVRCLGPPARALSRCRRCPRSTRPWRSRDPRVPESKRFCGHCGEPVGQAGRPPGDDRGILPALPHRFLVRAQARAGRAGGRAVRGPRLPRARRTWLDLPGQGPQRSDRWVVLKGLLNTGDPDAMEAAIAEGRFLAQVEHPNIVKIFNFVQHASRRDGETAGYIVMEYVGGKSLKQIRRRRASAARRCRWRTRSPTRSRSCPRSATCTTAGSSTATSSRTT